MFSRPLVITDVGVTLLLRAAGGEQFTFTKFQAGDGFLSPGETPQTMTALKHVVVDDIGITKAESTEDDGYIRLDASFDNQSDVPDDFVWTELGLIAEDEDSNEYLYAYAYDGEYAELIKAGGSAVMIEQYISAIIAVGDTQNITVNIIPDAVYASKAAFDAHVADHSNPHQVTYTQAGAAAAVHTHSAADITSGTLAVDRGGTGVASYSALAAALGLNIVMGTFEGDGTTRKDITLGFKPSNVVLIRLLQGKQDVYARAWNFYEHNNVYHDGCPTSAQTEDADTLLARNHGGAAVTSTGFAVGYYNSANSAYMNTPNYKYFYIAWR